MDLVPNCRHLAAKELLTAKNSHNSVRNARKATNSYPIDVSIFQLDARPLEITMGFVMHAKTDISTQGIDAMRISTKTVDAMF